MSKTCLRCGKQFTPCNHRLYCSDQCARQAKVNHNNEWNKRSRDKQWRKQARDEARYLHHLAYECGVDEMADYIYNNYYNKWKTK